MYRNASDQAVWEVPVLYSKLVRLHIQLKQLKADDGEDLQVIVVTLVVVKSKKNVAADNSEGLQVAIGNFL